MPSVGFIYSKKLVLHNDKCIVKLSIVIYVYGRCSLVTVKTCWWKWVVPLNVPSSVIVFNYIYSIYTGYSPLINLSDIYGILQQPITLDTPVPSSSNTMSESLDICKKNKENLLKS